MNDMFGGRLARDAGASTRVKGWVRDVFGLDPEVTLLVAELTCREPGCPPLETSISFLQAARRPQEHKLHKAVAQITRDDIVGLARKRARTDHNQDGGSRP